MNVQLLFLSLWKLKDPNVGLNHPYGSAVGQPLKSLLKDLQIKFTFPLFRMFIISSDYKRVWTITLVRDVSSV